MYLIYQPEGSDEPKRWKYEPKKLMSAEREELERRTDRNYSSFTQDVLAGNSLCRRALLFVMLKRDHPGTRFDDIDYAWDELTLEFTRGELEAMREKLEAALSGDELRQARDAIDAEIAKAPEDEGKAQLPTAE